MPLVGFMEQTNRQTHWLTFHCFIEEECISYVYVNCAAAGNPQNSQYKDMISVINDFDMHPNFHYSSNHDASKNTLYQVPFHSTFPISI